MAVVGLLDGLDLLQETPLLVASLFQLALEVAQVGGVLFLLLQRGVLPDLVLVGLDQQVEQLPQTLLFQVLEGRTQLLGTGVQGLPLGIAE